jgi:hypothetical protein
MAMLPFAFSIHNFISSVGADAGFAAIVGLAVLVLLYFAHARETANLREEAALLTQRLQQAEARVLQLSRSQTAPAAAGAAVAVAEPAIAMFAPAFTAAPALGSATRVIAEVAEPEREPEAEPEPMVQPVAAPVPAMAMAGVAAAPPESPPPTPPAVAPGPALPAPATSAGGNGSSHPPPPSPPEPVAAQPSRTTRPVQSSRPLASRPMPPLVAPRRRQRSRVGRNVAIALTALAAVAAAVVLFALTSVGASKHPSGGSASNSPTTGHAGAAAFKPSSVTVAVLNGTAVNHLAHRIAAKLTARGYKTGPIATAANQTETTTVIAFQPGKDDREDALHVAKALGVRSSAVQPIDPGTLQVACPTTSTCTANVVVTVGSDLAGQ